MNVVEVRNISKYYTLGKSQWSRLRHIFAPAGAIHAENNSSTLCALRDVSFSVAEGEAFGIVGANGSGKSTLLQIVAGILRPTSGSVEMHGRCSTLLELGSGFAPEFTGRQNVFLNATILGLSREEIEEKFEAIHRFSGIGDFVDQPIRTYSTGMVLRLAFSVAVHTEPRILIVDEALAVGDAAFRQRCMRRIHDLRAAGVTILFVSHDTGDVKALCERCLWLDRGLVRGLGEADEVVARYLATTVASHQKPGPATAPAPPLVSEAIPGAIPEAIPTPLAGTHRYGNRAAEVIACSRPAPDAASDVFLRLRVRALDHVAAPILGFLVRNAKGETIFGTNSARENHPLPALRPGEEHSVDFLLDMPRLAPGPYTISAAVSNGAIDKFEVCDYIEDALAFTVEPHARPVEGYLELPCRAVVIHRHAPDS